MSFGRLRAVRWAETSIVFQGALHSLNPLQPVGRQVGEPVELHEPRTGRGATARRVDELLEQVGLSRRLSAAYPHQLSGGQKQRVMIAMALACRPRLIVADEPTTALDVMVQAQVLDLLTSLVRELGVGLVVISHDLVGALRPPATGSRSCTPAGWSRRAVGRGARPARSTRTPGRCRRRSRRSATTPRGTRRAASRGTHRDPATSRRAARSTRAARTPCRCAARRTTACGRAARGTRRRASTCGHRRAVR